MAEEKKKAKKGKKDKKAKVKAPRWLGTGEEIQAKPLPPHELEAAIADGLSIARFSVVLALKNRLIVAALRDDLPFDTATAAVMAREELHEIAREQDRNIEHAEDVSENAGSAHGAARHEHDYKARDLALLTARRRVYEAVAAQARADADDPKRVAELVEDARVRAWEEISREVAARLDVTGAAEHVVVDEQYLAEREVRMRRLREIDLWELADQQHARTARRKKR
ncbi:hypothetical protein [Herbiconiux sp.]|uniref:hypothetical protein n=1 Tax=Herbiconiux sp. TaxID=1871186 RepID=UPI0025C3BBB3|nr:hypothetical protein [Herbiconiux sp.]